MPDVQILAPGTHPSPLDYVVPGAQEILIKAVAAEFDGSSAADAYVPCLQFIAPGGVLAASCPLGSSVAAGSSVDVSWFPGVSASATGTAVTVAFASYSGSATFTSGVTSHFDLTWDGTAGQTDLFTISGGFDPVAKETGYYWFTYTVFASHAGALTGFLGLSMDVNNSAGGAGFASSTFPLVTSAAGHPGPKGMIGDDWPLQAGDTFDHGLVQDSGGDLTFSAIFDVLRLTVG